MEHVNYENEPGKAPEKEPARVPVSVRIAEFKRLIKTEIPEELGFAWSTIILGAILLTLQVLFMIIILGMVA
jgi:hypothetical protein